MPASVHPFQSLRSTPLAIALMGALAAGNIAAQAADNARVALRAEPAHRIFADFPAPSRHRPATPGSALTVTTCADDGPGSLRAAVAAAADGDTIDLTTLHCGTITLQTGAIPVPLDNLTLTGPGRGVLAIDGNAADRVFIHPGHGELALNALTIRNGRDRATGFHVAGGGCIASAGYLTLTDSMVSSCYAGGEGAYGGAIYAYALTLSNSTLSGNVANGVHEDAGTAAFGGAAFVYLMQFVDSTVSGNRAEHHVNVGRTSYDIGGGVISVRGGQISGSTIDSNVSQGRGGGIATFTSIQVSNSTISGNVAASGAGGGVFLRWPSAMQLDNSTVTANRGVGGGVWLAADGSSFNSSIVHGNAAVDSTDPLVASFPDVQAQPLQTTTATVGGSHNLVGSYSPNLDLPPDTRDIDPQLGPLAFNGGLTRTHALLEDSPAIDAGANPLANAYDQRGAPFARVSGAAADIGAYERQAPPPAQMAAPVPTVSGWGAVCMVALLAALAVTTQLRGGARRR